MLVITRGYICHGVGMGRLDVVHDVLGQGSGEAVEDLTGKQAPGTQESTARISREAKPTRKLRVTVQYMA